MQGKMIIFLHHNNFTEVDFTTSAFRVRLAAALLTFKGIILLNNTY